MKIPYQHIVSLTALVLTTSNLTYGMQTNADIPALEMIDTASGDLTDPEINVNKNALEVLPPEMYGEISSFLTPEDRANARPVSQEFNKQFSKRKFNFIDNSLTSAQIKELAGTSSLH
jgi:hypothetical protein